MTQTIKISIQNKAGTTFGPYHWKHIIEWSEFDLLNDYTCESAEGAQVAINKLVGKVGVPPAICTHTILYAPMSQGQSGSLESMRKLKVLGFPEVSGSINQELGDHLIKRLLMSDEALAAEDPAFTATGLDAFAATISEVPQQTIPPLNDESTRSTSVIKEDPQEHEIDPIINPFAEGDEVSPHNQEGATDRTINPFAEGDEVGTDEADDDDFTPIRKKESNKIIFLIAALLVVGGVGGVGIYVATQQDKTELSTDATTTEEISLETVQTDGVAAEMPEETSPIITEIVEETIKGIEDQLMPGMKDAVQKAVDKTVDDVVSKAIVEAEGDANLDTVITAATSSTEATEVDKAASASAEKTVAASSNSSTETEDVKETVSTSEEITEENIESIDNSTQKADTSTEGVTSPTKMMDQETEAMAANPGTSTITEKPIVEEAIPEPAETSDPVRAPEPTQTSAPTQTKEPAKSTITIDSTGKTIDLKQTVVPETDRVSETKKFKPAAPIEKFPDYVPSF
jgi:hypothetical protein